MYTNRDPFKVDYDRNEVQHIYRYTSEHMQPILVLTSYVILVLPAKHHTQLYTLNERLQQR